MGIPKLFKILSERYPSLSQVVPANQLPQYDYLYIDLNNLIHKASSEKSLLPLEKLDDEYYLEERVFERIFCHIETLHRIIPSKVLFLSIDGVAPRAKWATQRERRLRENVLQTQFDSNAISPGTNFMVNFEKALMEYMSNKAKYHANWQNCEIFVSGSNCPGEGSIKIIDFIRSLKNSKDFIAHQTHCIYSGDNDYLLLGIATHELYISLIHEKKKFASSLAALCANDVKHQFEVIHFETLRQYLRMEFVECKDKMTFEFDMDHISDDWIILMTLIGNDYVPGLPNFTLDHNVLTMIYDAYKTVLQTSNGYMNEYGFLNLRRFARLILNLKPKDFDLYRNSHKNSIQPTTEKVSAINFNNNNVDDTKLSTHSEPRFSDFMEMKDQFYALKLGETKLPNYEQMSASYVKMIQWTLFYYYRDTCSWNEYYPYDCAPFVSDFVDIHKTTFQLECDKPVKIFTHLLAILPMRSSHLLPRCYQLEMFDDLKIPRCDDLLEKIKRAEMKLQPDDEERNAERPMLKLQYVGTEKCSSSVEVVEISNEKKTDSIADKSLVYRPFNREDFNFQFSTLNLHDYTFKLDAPSISKPYPRWMVCLNANQSFADAIAASESFMDQPVYVNWPHYTEAKVVQIFDASKKIWLSDGVTKTMNNPPEFNACTEQLNSRYAECGINVGKIELVAYVALLKWIEYKPSETKPNAYELVKHWDDRKWEPAAIQTLIQSSMPGKEQHFKLVKDVLRKTVILFGNKSTYFGEVATIADTQNLDVNGRVHILSYVDQPPNFDKAIRVHTAIKHSTLNEFKQPSTAATLLGISEKVFARVTGAVLVSGDNDTDWIRKINIGLQLKVRGVYQSSVAVLHDYVKQNGKQFVYSQLAIDLVQQYMDKFPRVFKLLNSSELRTIRVSDFDNNGKQSALDHLNEIRNWLQSLPISKAKRTSLESMQLSSNAIKNVHFAVHTTHGAEAKILRLKMRWQNLYIPDLNNVFVVPMPEATYKLLDRVMIVRSGYPVSIGTKGTVVAIEPAHNYIPGTEITDNELYALEILMDHPYKAPLAADEFKRHKIFRTRSTNMLINISYGRAI